MRAGVSIGSLLAVLIALAIGWWLGKRGIPSMS